MSRVIIQIVLVALTVVAITGCVHWPCVQNGFTHWDDDAYLELARVHIVPSWEVVGWAFTMNRPYYHPLTWLSHALDCHVWGPNPTGHHAVSLGWHAFNAGLVVTFVWLLLGATALFSEWERLALAAGIGLAFGIHPLQVESVAWIAERKNVLFGFFSLATLCAYIRWTTDGRDRLWYFTVLILYIAALCSKPLAVSVPAVMLVMDCYPLQRAARIGWRRMIWEKLPLILLAFVAVVLSFTAQLREGTVMSWAGHGLAERTYVAMRAIIFYLWKLIWPAWLSPFYPLGSEISLGDREFLISVVTFSAITAICMVVKNRAPALLSAWLAYLFLIIPASGITQVGGQAAADRYVYLAMLPLLLALGSGAVWIARRWQQVGRAAVVATTGCWLVFFGVRTRQQIPAWRNDVTLWNSVLAYYPNSAVANCRLAMAFVHAGRFDEALPPAEKSVAMDFEYPLARSTLGLIYLKTRRYEPAVAELQAALQLAPHLPNTQYNLACAYSRLGQFERAYETLRNLCDQNPGYMELARRDRELEGLRNHPEYGQPVRALWGQDGGRSEE